MPLEAATGHPMIVKPQDPYPATGKFSFLSVVEFRIRLDLLFDCQIGLEQSQYQLQIQ
jgi:hypothetical protein